MVRNHSFRILLAGAIPALSLAGALAGLHLFMSLTESMKSTVGGTTVAEWAQVFTALLVVSLCCFITLWWTSSYLYFVYRLILFELKMTTYTPSVPTWAPSVLKMLIGGSLSISLIGGPQQAYAFTDVSNTPSITRISQTESPLFTAPLPRKDQQPSIKYPSDIQATKPGTDSPTSFSPLFNNYSPASYQSTTALNVSRHHMISPLFGGVPSLTNSSPPEGSFATTPKDNRYTVTHGDSLWSIAEKHLPEHASGTEVLNMVHQIQHLNSAAIPTLETVIFPGQQIVLPL